MKASLIVFAALVLVLGGFLFYRSSNQFELPEGETVRSSEGDENLSNEEKIVGMSEENQKNEVSGTREVLVTGGVKHSIPLGEILSGGPPKDGIPSIDNPKFVSLNDADSFLKDDSIGLGLIVGGEKRFYPYLILVWHEIVNDTVGGVPALVTYCPLCATGVVFKREVDGVEREFGVSGRLWQSNLLMYDRAGKEKDESLWSQVLGEAVLGPATGARLEILSSDTVRYSDWKKKHPDTLVLSRDTGATRTYGFDPYGGYYTDESVSFGATFNDDRLHPKAFVFGVEIDGKYKAYHRDALKEGVTEDTFAGNNITIEKDDIGGVRMFIGTDREPLSYIGGFWFSWLAVHPLTELFK